MKNPKSRLIIVLGFLLLFSFVLAACGQEPEEVEVTRIVEQTVEVEVPGPEVEVTRIVEVETQLGRGAEVASAIPFVPLWEASGHNDTEGEAFNHWNEDDPAEVPEGCAKCHSTPGYIDFLGADGSEFGVVDMPHPIGTTVECQACHNDVTLTLTSVVFPSGIEVTGLGDEARCMQCHQGRASKFTVDQGIADAGLGEGDEDTVSEDVGFTNIHYYAAAATQYGTIAKGGYEYDGKTYDSRFEHVEPYNQCMECHNPHTLEVKLDECVACHTNVESAEDLVDIRMNGSLVDYDGDGDMDEGIMGEITGMQDLLYQAIQAYSSEVAGTQISYDPASYPYFFDEAGERFASWTPRLAKAAYNYQVSQKDPGEFAHGGKYIIQLLYDSTEDLNMALATPIDLSNAHRIDHGHFAGSEEAFRHWDEDGAVPGSCSRCHSADGLPLFIEEGVSIEQPLSNGFRCDTCHNDVQTFTRYEVESVEFPSGAELTLEDSDANLCINCHQGRSYSGTVDRRIGDVGDDEVSDSLGFINIHYFAAGATLFGNDAQGAYQYAGQEYLGRNEHVSAFDTCIECHDTHALQVEVEACANCHEGVESKEDLASIRVSEVDFDGDGDVTEGMAGEVSSMSDALLAAMQAYAAANEGVDNIGYDGHAYPYFFIDTNGDGVVGEDEADRYVTWTPKLLRAAYNYQYVQKDPGAFAHNGQYIIQILYDSLNSFGAADGMTRP